MIVLRNKYIYDIASLHVIDINLELRMVISGAGLFAKSFVFMCLKAQYEFYKQLQLQLQFMQLQMKQANYDY